MGVTKVIENRGGVMMVEYDSLEQLYNVRINGGPIVQVRTMTEVYEKAAVMEAAHDLQCGYGDFDEQFWGDDE